MNIERLQKDLAEVISRHSLENEIDMPDFLMAEMIVDYIQHLGHFHKKRDEWFGKGYFDKPVELDAPVS